MNRFFSKMAERWTLIPLLKYSPDRVLYYKKTLLKSVIHNSRTPLVRLSLPFLELFKSLWTLSSHRTREVPEGKWIWEVKFFWLIVSKNPREYWVLHQVIVWPTSKSVEVHQILEIGDLSSNPTLCHWCFSCSQIHILSHYFAYKHTHVSSNHFIESNYGSQKKKKKDYTKILIFSIFKY